MPKKIIRIKVNGNLADIQALVAWCEENFGMRPLKTRYRPGKYALAVKRSARWGRPDRYKTPECLCPIKVVTYDDPRSSWMHRFGYGSKVKDKGNLFEFRDGPTALFFMLHHADIISGAK